MNENAPAHKPMRMSELDSLGECARNQSWGYDGEHSLEHHERQMWNGLSIQWFEADTSQANVVEANNEVTDVRTECQGVAPQHPLHSNDAHNDKTLHHRGKYVLSAHKAALK